MPNPAKPKLRGLRSRAVSQAELLDFLNRELIPLVSEMRTKLNAAHLVADGDNNGDTLVWSSTTSEWELT